MVDMFAHYFLYFLDITELKVLFEVILLFLDQSNQMFERMSCKFFDFFVIFQHEDLGMVIYKLNGLLDWEVDAIAFKFIEYLVDFFPVKSALNVCMAVEA